VAGQWFSLGTPVSSTNKTDCHDISEILLKVVLNTKNQTKPYRNVCIPTAKNLLMIINTKIFPTENRLCTPESHLPPPSPPQRHSLLVSLVPFG
jgi:hypothetical protein